MFGVLEVSTGRWVYRLGRRCAADFIALLQMLTEAFPQAPVIAMICERIWAALENYLADTAVSWPGRLRQIHFFYRSRSPGQMLATAAPWTSPLAATGLRANFWTAT